MQPIELVSKRKGWQVVHRCTRCGRTLPNKVASGTNQADDIDVLVGLFRH
jgi:hypothetical protein